MVPALQLLLALVVSISATTGTAISRDHTQISRNREFFPTSQHVLQRNPLTPNPSVLDTFHNPSPNRTLSKGGLAIIPYLDKPIPWPNTEEPFKLEHHKNIKKIFEILEHQVQTDFLEAEKRIQDETSNLIVKWAQKPHTYEFQHLPQSEQERFWRDMHNIGLWSTGQLKSIWDATWDAMSHSRDKMVDQMWEREHGKREIVSGEWRENEKELFGKGDGPLL